MYEKYLIQTHGFTNVIRGGATTEFEPGIKITYYRGVSLSIIDTYLNALSL